MQEIIEFKNVTKIYKLFKNDKKRFVSLFFKNIKVKEKRAVDNVSFKINKGEAVAIFGKNGAGKSTILKMITGVTFPTEGNVTVNGRVSALLELTSGFDQEFTGRENIYLKGQILGLKNKEIQELEQTIIDFAELEEYIDQPVRTYSSGMKAKRIIRITDGRIVYDGPAEGDITVMNQHGAGEDAPEDERAKGAT